MTWESGVFLKVWYLHLRLLGRRRRLARVWLSLGETIVTSTRAPGRRAGRAPRRRRTAIAISAECARPASERVFLRRLFCAMNFSLEPMKLPPHGSGRPGTPSRRDNVREASPHPHRAPDNEKTRSDCTHTRAPTAQTHQPMRRRTRLAHHDLLPNSNLLDDHWILLFFITEERNCAAPSLHMLWELFSGAGAFPAALTLSRRRPGSQPSRLSGRRRTAPLPPPPPPPSRDSRLFMRYYRLSRFGRELREGAASPASAAAAGIPDPSRRGPAGGSRPEGAPAGPEGG
jgi:hypothetical protein